MNIVKDFINRLDEFTYKDVMNVIDGRDLPHRDYAPLIKSVRYVSTKGNTMKFFVPNRYNGWNVFIRYPQWGEQVRDVSVTAVEAARLLLWSGDLQLFCACPSYVFHGYKYVQTMLGMAIVPETIFPKIRNPHLKGICCKHQRRVIPTLPFHLGDMATAIKQQRSRLGL